MTLCLVAKQLYFLSVMAYVLDFHIPRSYALLFSIWSNGHLLNSLPTAFRRNVCSLCGIIIWVYPLCLWRSPCSTLLAPSCQQIFKLLCLLWLLEFTTWGIGNLSCWFAISPLPCKWPVFSQSMLPAYWSFLLQMHTGVHTRSQEQNRGGMGFALGVFGVPVDLVARFPEACGWTSCWEQSLQLYLEFLSASPNVLPPPSRSSHLSTLGADWEKWVSPVTSHPAKAASQSLSTFLFPHRRGHRCWTS